MTRSTWLELETEKGISAFPPIYTQRVSSTFTFILHAVRNGGKFQIQCQIILQLRVSIPLVSFSPE